MAGNLKSRAMTQAYGASKASIKALEYLQVAKTAQGRKKSLSTQEREKIFVREYLIDFNQTRAAMASNPNAKDPDVIGHDMMKRPSVKAALKLAMDERAKEAKQHVGLTPELVLGILHKIILHDPRTMFKEDGLLKDVRDFDDASALNLSSFECVENKDPTTGKVTGYTKKVRLGDRATNLTLALRHLGLLNDKMQLNIPPLQTFDTEVLNELSDKELELLDHLTAKLQGAQEA